MTNNEKILIIVESPGKINKIKQYLGSNYIIKASFGHLQDLDKKTLSIDVNNNFKPNYVINQDKLKVVKELKDISKQCKEVILAADGDREGEYIAYSLSSILKLNNPKRIVFHEITKNALNKAILDPQTINMNMVNAQQTRRLLDRLMGYLISPILKIIIDKENEINQCISEAYLKTSGLFLHNKIKINSYLQNNSKLYIFKLEDIAILFLKSINKKTIIKVISIENKKSQKKPSPPFITSTLQQDASSKLHFNVKKTMDVAQKLYEAGFITYMRTDCPNISNEAINDIEKYIIEKYGNEYSDPKNYQSKNANSQDAHECIRPTDINIIDIDDLSVDCKKLYSLIWKRTIASQMSNCKLNIQTIKIDLINNNKSILKIEENQLYFISIFENIEFSGYLIIYDNNVYNEDDSDKSLTGKCEININDELKIDKIKISTEYTKPSLRYNESLLIKYLEKNGIGRPSTYASIISKVLERGYIEIKDIPGIKKESKIIELNNKYILNENIKELIIGKENKKMICTDNGIKVNNFLMEHFNSIININFTSNFESYLDKISTGNANWITVLKQFYDMFFPIIEKLNLDIKKNLKSNTDILIGLDDNNNEIYQGSGKYGPYLKIKINNVWKFTSIKDENILKNMNIDNAKELLKFPKNLGKIGTSSIDLYNGPYGLYIKYLNKNIPIKDKKLNIDDINLDLIKKYIK
jgi:DNA topoisomerase-1